MHRSRAPTRGATISVFPTIQKPFLEFPTLFQAPLLAMVRNQFLRFSRGVPEKPVLHFFFVHAEKYPGACGAGQLLLPCPVTLSPQLYSTHLLTIFSF